MGTLRAPPEWIRWRRSENARKNDSATSGDGKPNGDERASDGAKVSGDGKASGGVRVIADAAPTCDEVNRISCEDAS